MLTPFGEKLDRERPLFEYPRPQMQRDGWECLNGEWERAFRPSSADERPPLEWDGPILVPFSPESELSGVGRTLQADETLWMRRRFSRPQGFDADKRRLLLHFGAVDQEATVYLNGRELGGHVGGYTAFSLDATEALQEENELVVRIHDDTDRSWHSRGKQSGKRGGIWYTPQSGIWQTVWMETVPREYIHRLRLRPDVDRRELELTVFADAAEAEAILGGERFSVPTGAPARIPVRAMRLWSPEDPYLYTLEIRCGEDRVQSYFGMRKTEIRKDKNGVKRLFLNGKPYFHNGLLDQGYWPDGLYTAPSDEAMIFDIQTAKSLGYNVLRKHIKVEPARWYYHCDRLGMLVWQDMVNGGERYRFSTITLPLVTNRSRRDDRYRPFARQSPQGREEYRRELTEMILQLDNSPSIVLWTPFNEGWGQFDAKEACALIDSLDGSRPIDHASGWHDQKIGELKSWHVYFRPYRFHPDKLGRAVALTEFGGFHLRLEDNCWSEKTFGYKGYQSREELWEAYRELMEKQILPAIPKGLCATVYTQLTDVEEELNGVMTYDRLVVKLPEKKLKELNQRLFQAGSEGE